MNPQVQLTPFEADDALELTKMWRASFERAVHPYRCPDSVESQARYLTDFLAPRAEITVARTNAAIVGFMARVDEEIEQLYIDIAHQGQGIGKALLLQAKHDSPERLHLYTFQRNVRARRFYLAHGFREIALGFENMEGPADVELQWG